ncbi:MAG: SpoIIE family protein phosphatase [Flavobacteriales bacterium]|nr:SpoIIE family protein phosphatase [Flavobacteriales bacterium]
MNHWADFKTLTEVIPNHYYFASLVFGLVLGTIVIHLHESSKESYLNELAQSKSDVEEQKKILEQQKEEIISSIQYARRMQNAILPQEDVIYRNIPLSFILYKPRDIVSGDFFWFHEINADNYIIVCADCTGHGVPGALMTVIGSNLLTQIITENRLYQPAKILQELDERISATLK